MTTKKAKKKPSKAEMRRKMNQRYETERLEREAGALKTIESNPAIKAEMIYKLANLVKAKVARIQRPRVFTSHEQVARWLNYPQFLYDAFVLPKLPLATELLEAVSMWADTVIASTRYIDRPYQDRVDCTYAEIMNCATDKDRMAVARHVVNLESRCEAAGIKWWEDDE